MASCKVAVISTALPVGADPVQTTTAAPTTTATTAKPATTIKQTGIHFIF